MGAQPLRVFVSHTSELAAFPQNRSYVEAACAAVRRAGGVAVDMADFGARDQPSAQVCRAEVAGCDVYLAVVGFRYGALVPGRDDGLSFTEFEFDVAGQAGLPRLVFLLDEASVPVALADVDRRRVGRFRLRLQDEQVTVTVASPDDLAARVAEGLATLTRAHQPSQGRRPWMAEGPVDLHSGAPGVGEVRPQGGSWPTAPPTPWTRGFDPAPAVTGVMGVTNRDVNSLLGELVRVDCVNDPDQFDAWKSELERILGRFLDIPPTSVLAAKLLAVVEEAVAQPGPRMLDAVARALETVDPTDRQVARFRHLVDQLGQRWGAASTSPASVQLSVDLPRRAPAARLDEPPRYRFFTSYARHRDNKYVRRLHDALQAELEHRLPRDEAAVGFLDLLSLEGGAHWRHELREAARTTPVLLALWSDDYFRSDWCGREFAVFAERMRRATPAGGAPPAGVLPLNWLPVDHGSIPDCAQGLQLTNLHLGGGFDEMPLFDLLRQHQRAFPRYITGLAKRIISVTRHPLPPLDAATADNLEPAFGRRP
jgi:hypothetical protein